MLILNNNLNPFGLDFSDKAIKVAQLVKKGGRLGLFGCGREELPEGIIEDGEIKKPDELAQFIKNALHKALPHAIKSKFVIYSIPETKGFIRLIKIPPIDKENLESEIFSEIEQLFPISPEESYIDWQILKEEDNGWREVLVAAVPQLIVDSYSEVLAQAGLKPVAAEIESIAICRSLTSEKLSSRPVLVIDLGKDRTGFIIANSSTVQFTASIPVCGEELNRAIVKKLNISEEEAEACRYKCGVSAKGECEKIYKAIESSLEEMVSYIEKLLIYYHEHYKDEPDISKAIICGGESQMPGISSFLSLKIKKEVEKGNPWINIIPQEAREIPPISRNNSLVFVTVLGLALRGVEEENLV